MVMNLSIILFNHVNIVAGGFNLYEYRMLNFLGICYQNVLIKLLSMRHFNEVLMIILWLFMNNLGNYILGIF